MDITGALAKAGYDRSEKCLLLGFRPWFLGNRPGNERGIYDDAIVVVSPTASIAYNANTDPSYVRKGRGTGASKGMACLKTGCWLYKIGTHRGNYTALVQADEVTVIRDGNPNYPDTGFFGINIHRGSRNSTSSLGCQTIHPDQWASFITTAMAEMKRHGQKVIPYVLVDWKEVA
jgi:hypothetical protein